MLFNQSQALDKKRPLVGGWTNPFEKYARQNGSCPQMSNAQNPYDIPLYWLINRDPYHGLL